MIDFGVDQASEREKLEFCEEAGCQLRAKYVLRTAGGRSLLCRTHGRELATLLAHKVE